MITLDATCRRISIDWSENTSPIELKATVATLLDDESVPNDYVFLIDPSGAALSQSSEEIVRIATTIDLLRSRFNGRFAVYCESAKKRWLCRIIAVAVDRGVGRTKLFESIVDANAWLTEAA